MTFIRLEEQDKIEQIVAARVEKTKDLLKSEVRTDLEIRNEASIE